MRYICKLFGERKKLLQEDSIEKFSYGSITKAVDFGFKVTTYSGGGEASYLDFGEGSGFRSDRESEKCCWCQ